MTLPDQIRQAIAPAHVRIEQTPMAQKMASGTISRSDYVHGLKHLLALHAGLENIFATVEDPAFCSLYNPIGMDRSAAIQRDLIALQAEPLPIEHDLTTRFLEQVQFWANQSPWCLIGVLYVLEGSRMGSMVLTRSLARAFQVDPRPNIGLDYHLEGQATRPADWQKFKGVLLAQSFTQEQATQLSQAAVQTMEALVDLYSALSGVPAVELVAQ